jgi:hypothetical protein
MVVWGLVLITKSNKLLKKEVRKMDKQVREVDFYLVDHRLRAEEEKKVVIALNWQMWNVENQLEQLLGRCGVLGRGRYDGSVGPRYVVKDEGRRGKYSEMLKKVREMRAEIDELLREIENEIREEAK